MGDAMGPNGVQAGVEEGHLPAIAGGGILGKGRIQILFHQFQCIHHDLRGAGAKKKRRKPEGLRR
jgi:hypothetical protein